MKILVNASTLIVGGGVQVALNFIKHVIQTSKHEYYYILSKELALQLGDDILNFDHSVIDVSPAKRLKGRRSRQVVLKIEKDFNPDIVYSIGAPSYINFVNIEVLRLTNPWVIGGEKLPYSAYSFLRRLIARLKVSIKRKYIKKEHFIITQTNTAKNDIGKTLKISKKQIFVVPNIHSSIFKKQLIKVNKADNVFNIFVFAAPHIHKNLKIIPEVAKHLLNIGVNNFKFNVTIPKDLSNKQTKLFFNKIKKLNVSSNIENLGKINFNDAPSIYQNSDMLFLPTLLEVFSVTYLEAMESKIPIVTTDLPFSRDVCNNAALYFDPECALDAAKKIKEIIENRELKKQLLINAKDRLNVFLKEDVIYGEHIKVLEEIRLNNI